MDTLRRLAAALVGCVLALTAAAAEIEFKPFPMPSNDDTFVQSGLRAPARKEIFDNVAATAYAAPDSLDAELRVHRQRVGPWLVAVVRGTSVLCEPTGNCQTWLF